jgi:hypothetical protein
LFELLEDNTTERKHLNLSFKKINMKGRKRNRSEQCKGEEVVAVIHSWHILFAFVLIYLYLGFVNGLGL